MSFSNVKWRTLFQVLPAWRILSPDARRFVIRHVTPSQQLSPEKAGPAGDELLAAGLLAPTGRGRSLMVPEPLRPVVLLLRAMHRQRLFDEPSDDVLLGYLHEHFLDAELAYFADGEPFFQPDVRGIAADGAASGEWVEALLNAAAKGKMAHAQRLVRELLPHPDGVPLLDVLERWRATAKAGTEKAEAALANAMDLTLGGLTLFIGLRAPDEELVIGLWPPVARALTQTPAAAPAAVTPGATFHAALLLEDATVVLAAAEVDPLRLRQDRSLTVKMVETLRTRLMEIPAWIIQGANLTPITRLHLALNALQDAELLGIYGPLPSRLRPTPAGSAWLARSAHDRLAAFLDIVRASPERTPASMYRYPGDYLSAYFEGDFDDFAFDDGGRVADDLLYDRDDDPGGLAFFSARVPVALPRRPPDLRAALTAAFLSAPAGAYVPLDEFVRYHADIANPLFDPEHRRGADIAGRRTLRALWRDILKAFLIDRLVLLGGAALGQLPERRFAFTLTDVGRYLLGAAATFSYDVDAAAEVVVQPNFEIVFLTSAPVVEARLSRFAERTGRRTGVMFRVTRASVLAAAESGMAGDAMLETLRTVSSKPIPQNVAYQIRDWTAGVRRIPRRTAILLDCPDVETAMKLRSLGGAKVRPLTDTVLEVLNTRDGKLDAALLKRWRQAGLFIEGARQP